MTPIETYYRLDRQSHIVDTGGEWDRFARENKGNHVLSADILSRPITDFISGDATRMWLETLINFVRISRKPIERTYRCDSPRIRRFMRMQITPDGPGLLTLTHRVESVEMRKKPVTIHPALPITPGRIRQRCSICGRIRMDQTWHEPEVCRQTDAAASETLDAAGSTASEPDIYVIYTVCPDCRKACSVPPLKKAASAVG